jgi:hypothetical protein
MKRRRRDMKVFSGNRANRHSLTREFESSIERLQRSIPDKRAKLTTSIAKLQVKMNATMLLVKPEAFHLLGTFREQLRQAQQELQALDGVVECQQRQFQSLVSFNSVEALVFANRLLNRPPELFPVEVDKCECGKLFVFNATQTTNKSHTGNNVESVLFHIDDNSADTLILRLPVSGTASVPQPEALTRAGLLPMAANQKRPGRSSASVRSSNYRKFLVQFTSEVSDAVMAYIHSHHNRTVHTHGGSLCRSTRFASFLRESEKFSAQNQDATAITLCFYSGKTQLLSFALVDKLVDRFEEYRLAVSVLMPEKEAKKCAALEFLTNRFLVMEGEVKLSRNFELPKTRTVLRAVNKRFVEVCQTLKWEIPRAI